MASEGKLEESHREENTKEPNIETENVKVEEKEIETENSMVEEKKTETETEKKIETETAKVEEKKTEEGEASNTVKERDTDESGKTEIERSSSAKEETNVSSELKENEMKALNELRSKLEESILQNKLLKSTKEKEKEKDNEIQSTKSGEEEKDPKEKTEETEKEKGENVNENENEKEKEKEKETAPSAETVIKAETTEQVKVKAEESEKGKGFAAVVEEAQEKLIKQDREAETEYNVDKDIAIWGVPLLPSKGDNRTDTILLKFLRARDFKANDAFEMLRNTLKWRKDNKIDSILDEDMGADVGSMAIMEGHDRNGHPVCYNVFSVLGNEEMYGKTFEERREKFVRGRIQIMEKGIQKLDFRPGGVSTILQISDLKNTPLPTKKELRNATKKVVELLQDNYPEFVAKNVFINVPFWYYAYSALFSPSLSQRTKGKIVYARSARVSDTLLKYIPASQILVQYGGLKRESDSEFSVDEEVKEANVKSGSTEVIEILAPEEGKTLVWEVSVSGWEVNYKEEFVPADEGSYTIIVSKGKRIGFQEGTIRNSFTNKEPGKIVITIENGAFKKKRILYRYKVSSTS